MKARRPGWAALGLLALLLASTAGLRADDAAATALAQQIEATVNKGDAKVLAAHFAMPALTDRALAGLPADDAFALEFRQGLQKNLDFPAIITAAASNGGRYKFLRLVPDPLGTRARFRLTGAEGLNYHDLLLVPAADGTLQVQDVWVWRTGEWLSATIRRGYGPFVAQQKAGEKAPLSEADATYLQHFPEISQMQTLVREQHFAPAIKVYAGLPEALRHDKTLLLLRLRAATMVGGELFDEAVSDFRRAFPDDPALEVTLFEYYFNNSKPNEAMSSLNRLDREVGGDPYLEVQRAALCLQSGDLATARQRSATAARLEPDLPDVYWVQLIICCRELRYDAAVAVLDTMTAKAGAPSARFEKSAVFKNFAASEQFKNWRARQPK